jgi:hypothetical protein
MDSEKGLPSYEDNYFDNSNKYFIFAIAKLKL